MKNNLWQKLKKPKGIFLVLLYLTTAICIAGALIFLFADHTKPVVAILAYIFYAMSAIGLAYSVYTIVIYAGQLKNKVVLWANGKPFVAKLVKNYGFRTLVMSALATALTIFVAVLHAYIGISKKSVWYGALASYYILLVFIKTGIILADKKNSTPQKRYKRYRNCGVLLLVLNVALSSAIAQMIFNNRAFVYSGWTVIAFALYAFVKITIAIIQVFKAKKYNHSDLQAIRNVNLADALVSILALQTALLNSYGTADVNASLFNTLTGSAVSFGIVAIGVAMIVRSEKIMEKNNG